MALIRTSIAYGTVPHAIRGVLTDTMPAHLKAVLRTESYEIQRTRHQDQYDTRPTTGSTIYVSTERFRRMDQRIEERWREELLHYRENNCTRRLIDDSCIFQNNKRNNDYSTMHILNGILLMVYSMNIVLEERHTQDAGIVMSKVMM